MTSKTFFMTKKSIILLLVFMVATVSAEAQVRAGLKAGFNLSNVSAKDAKTGDKESYDMKPGFQAGGILDWAVGESFSVQPGVRFATQGFIDKYEDNGSFVRNFTLYYIQIPVNAQYRLPVGENAGVLFQAGPYFGIGLSGKQKATKNGVKQSLSDTYKKINMGNESSDDIRNGIDYGVGVGVGVEFFRFQVMAEYNFGLYEMTFEKHTPKLYNIDMKNNGLSVTMAFLFGKKRVTASAE